MVVLEVLLKLVVQEAAPSRTAPPEALVFQVPGPKAVVVLEVLLKLVVQEAGLHDRIFKDCTIVGSTLKLCGLVRPVTVL